MVSLINTQDCQGSTMISQQCLVELEMSDKVQVVAEPGSGIVDAASHHLTQFTGVLLRPADEVIKTAMKAVTEDEGLNFSDGFRGLTPSRGTTPNRGFTPGRHISPLPGKNIEQL